MPVESIRRLVAVATSAAALASASVASAQSHEQFYEDNQQMFASLGMSREKAIQIGLYLEGVGIVGMCRAYMDAGDVAYWRTWADELRNHENPLAARIPDIAERAYQDGVEDQRQRRLDEGQCDRVWHSFQVDWTTADQRLAASMARKAGSPSASQ